MIILGTNSIKDTGFNVDNSCRFNGDAYVHKAVSAGNQRTFTYSFWTKRSTLNNYDTFIGYAGTAGGGGGTARGELIFVGDGDDTLRVGFNPSASSWSNYTMNTGVFRDPSAWYNIVLKVNTTSGTEAERLKIFVNGVSQGLSGYPGQNFDTGFNVNNSVYHIGRSASGTGNFIKGYLAEAVFIDGTALDADSFGEFDDSGIWKPIDVSGLTFGTNGFYLDFENSGALGADVSGNTNNFTVNNLTAIDQSTDTCTNNFATLNPLASGSFPVFSEGNINVRANSDAEYGNVFSTLSTSSSGKWYYEIKVISKTGTSPWLGLVVDDAPKAGIATNGGANSAGSSSFSAPSFVIQSDGQVTQAGSAGTTYTSFAIGDIISFSIDMDNGACYIAKNGTYMNSGNPASAGSKTGAIITWTAGSVSGFLPAVSVYGASTSSGSFSAVSMNFGSPSFAISSGNTDGNGYGNFEYAVPSSYYSLNTKNLAEYG